VGEPPGSGQPALNADQILTAIDQGEIKALVLAESDPFWLSGDEERVAWALERLELLVVLDYLPSPVVRRAHVVLPTIPLFERTAAGFVNQEGRLQAALPVHGGGTPLALISPEVHPPRTFLDSVPGSDPRTPAEIFQELTQATSGLTAPDPVDLWAWLSRGNQVLARVKSLADHPEGVRLLPAVRTGQDFTAAPAPPEEPPAAQAELLPVDWTFGTEELASYAPVLREAEAEPVLCLHPRDAAPTGLADGDRAAVHLPKGSVAVTVRLVENMAPGVAVLPRHRRLDWRKLAEARVYLPPNLIAKVQG
jgi:predicted molibdopterin-dependent oxidoreductase YjgC